MARRPVTHDEYYSCLFSESENNKNEVENVLHFAGKSDASEPDVESEGGEGVTGDRREDGSLVSFPAPSSPTPSTDSEANISWCY